MRETWKEIGEVKHKLIVSNTLLVAMIAEIKKEREKNSVLRAKNKCID